jgi:hypothetical protein
MQLIALPSHTQLCRAIQGAVCLEEHLQLDRAPDGIVLSPALHYMEGRLLGQGLVDQIMWGIAC